MAALSKPDLLSKLIESINECGYHSLLVSDQHPFKLIVYREGEQYPLKIYIWNVSHGGGSARAANEYRIQVKVAAGFQQEAGWLTLILGWWDEGEVFAGFDIRKHTGLPGWSASFQIKLEALQKAYANGFATSDKENQEVAIAFRQDFFVEYVKNLTALHTFGESPRDLAILETVANTPDQVNDAAIEQISQARRVVVRSVQQRLRSSSFRRRVLTAYSHRCAFCGVQLELVQAAHVLPVSHNQSTDATSNGIAACFLHHAAYDSGLIMFNRQYQILENEKRLQHLVRVDRVGGLDSFRAALRQLILLPPDRRDRPHVDLIALANRSRGWK